MNQNAKKYSGKIFLGGLVLSLTLFSSVNAATFKGFSDVKTSAWYYPDVKKGVELNYIDQSKKAFYPGLSLKRAELAKLVVVAFKLPLVSPATPTFKDVPKSAWFYPYVETLVKYKAINGYKNQNGTLTGYFGPQDDINRLHAAKIIAIAGSFTLKDAQVSPFKDLYRFQEGYTYVVTLSNASVISGYPDRTFGGSKKINRAEGARMIAKALTAPGRVSTPPTPTENTSDSIEDQKVSFKGPNGVTLTGRLYKPAGKGPYPAVVFMHGCGGLLNDKDELGSQFEYWGKEMASKSSVALFVDSFTPRQIKEVCGDGTKLNEAVDRAKDAYAGLDYLKTLGYVQSEKVAIVGWSNGGSATLSAVAKNDNPARAGGKGFILAIAEYPGCGLRAEYGTDYSKSERVENGTYLPAISTIILAGAKDTTTPPTPKCVNLVEQAKALGASAQTGNSISLTIYPGAQHGFDRAEENDSEWNSSDIKARDSGRKVIIEKLSSTLGLK